MSSVIFENHGVDEVSDCAGATVGMFKQRLRDSHNIPYFADAIVNGEIVPVAYVLGDGDRLCFQKRFGVKSGDDRPFEEREAQGLIHAYGLDEIAAEVKVRNLPKDESIDLMVMMIRQWAARMFGIPDAQERKILSEIPKQLIANESRLEVTSHEIPPSATTDSDQGWCHPASANTPSDYPFGPLEGCQADLSSWLYSDGRKDHRRLPRKARKKNIWVREVHSRLYEVWFKTQREFDVALRRRDETKRQGAA